MTKRGLVVEVSSAKLHSNILKYYLSRAAVSLRLIGSINLLYYLSFSDMNYSRIGIMEMVAAVAILILEIPSGMLADMFGRKIALLVASVFSTIAFLLMSIGGFTLFLLGWGLSGIADAFESGAEDALLYDTLMQLGRADEYMRIRSRNMLFCTVMAVLGTAAGAALFTLDRHLPWVLYTLCILAGGVARATFVEPSGSQSGCSSGSRPGFTELSREAVRVIGSQRKLRWTIVFGMVLTFPFFVFTNLVSQPYLIQRGYSVVSLGVIFASIAGISGVLGAMSHRIEKRLGERRSFMLLATLLSSTLVLAGLVTSPGALLIVIVLYFLGNYQHIVISRSINEQIDSSSRATILSVQSFINNIFTATIIVLVGHLVDVLSIDQVLIWIGVGVAVLSAFLLLARYGSDSLSQE